MVTLLLWQLMGFYEWSQRILVMVFSLWFLAVVINCEGIFHNAWRKQNN